MSLLGLVQAMLVVNSVPEVIESFQIKNKIIVGYDKKLDNKVNDSIAGVQNLCVSASSLISPILGAVVYDFTNYKTTLNVAMIFVFFIGIVFLVFNCGLSVIQEQKTRNKELKNL